MKSLIKRGMRCWPRGEEGSFTLESSMVFPAIFFALLVLIMFSMYSYQKIVLYYTASVSAERAAFRWDNSKRDVSSGIGLTGQYDGLYWRMSSNGVIQSLFGFDDASSPDKSMRVEINQKGSHNQDTSEASSSNLPLAKMSRIADRIPEPFEGNMKYSYGLIEKRVEVALRQPLSITPLEAMLGSSEPNTMGHANVVDPVEGIRNVDLVRYYSAKFSQMTDSKEKKKQASDVLSKRKVLDLKNK
ncbi:hypothetical protein FHS14_005205 [Paenibacillus baekrokdamisoli]|nr:pilus assembly protein [Paenibacillus baekrokdamisoli]MBB3072190.1 hypothetical protein [Paenibacillus baekrokdamisoli]